MVDQESGGSDRATMVELTVARFAEYDDRVAITVDDPDSPAEWTYRDVLHGVRREARRLEDAGVRHGDVVAIMLGNRPEALVLRWAANVAGAAFTAFADGFSAATISRRRPPGAPGARAPPRPRGPRADDAAARAGATVVTVDDDPPSDPGPRAARLRPDDLASISLTGGSTGVPKGVPRYAAVPAYFSPAALEGWRSTVQLACTPVAHIAGTIAMIVLAAGGRVVLQPRFDAARVLAAIPRERVTTVQLLPRLLHQMLDHPDLPGTDVSSLRAVRIGSAPASAQRLGEALDRLGPVVGQTYGSIEATTITSIDADELARPERRGTVGRPVGDVELSVRDHDGRELARGATGEVWVRSSGVMPGYVNDPQRTTEVLVDGWFRTGDLGIVDGDGYLTLVGRVKDVIFAEHARINPSEVEDCLVGHPDVSAAGVFADTDHDGTETAAAAVVPRTGCSPSPAALIDWVTEHRGAAVAPVDVHVVDDLPTTPSGKIDRDSLRRRLTRHR